MVNVLLLCPIRIVPLGADKCSHHSRQIANKAACFPSIIQNFIILNSLKILHFLCYSHLTNRDCMLRCVSIKDKHVYMGAESFAVGKISPFASVAGFLFWIFFHSRERDKALVIG